MTFAGAVDVDIPAGEVWLGGRFTAPEGAAAVVVFAHGSGSSRHSPRNRYVSNVLIDAGFATLLFDLLTPVEDAQRANVFDIGLLGRRLVEVTGWLRREQGADGIPLGYFGASTGAAAALWAAAELRADVGAVVSRGGRPDLATPQLPRVTAPTLLIVGGKDEAVLELNERAARQMTTENEVAVIPGATHVFEEPGALEAAAGLARSWFTRHLIPATARRH